MSTFCPHCSRDISDDAAVERGAWWLHPGGAFIDGERVALNRQQTRVLYVIARANGRPVTHDDIPGCGEGTLAHHLRTIRKALGERFPVAAVRGRGFAWAAGT